MYPDPELTHSDSASALRSFLPLLTPDFMGSILQRFLESIFFFLYLSFLVQVTTILTCFAAGASKIRFSVFGLFCYTSQAQDKSFNLHPVHLSTELKIPNLVWDVHGVCSLP